MRRNKAQLSLMVTRTHIKSSHSPSRFGKAISSSYYLGGHFLISTPTLEDTRFDRTVIYMCAHDEEHAMGIIINRPKQGVVLSELLNQIGRSKSSGVVSSAENLDQSKRSSALISSKGDLNKDDVKKDNADQNKAGNEGQTTESLNPYQDTSETPPPVHTSSLLNSPVLAGGPVEPERGFVLHSPDYFEKDVSLNLSETLTLSTTKGILAAMSGPDAPAQAVLALGYAGWSAGQLEDEIKQNAWLTVAVDSSEKEAIIFDQSKNQWEAALNLIGIKPESLTHLFGQA